MSWFNFVHHRWLDLIFPPRADEIIVRYIGTDDFLSLVTPQLVPETRPGTVALLPYHDEKVRSAIHEAKYHGNERAFQLLALALVEYLRDADDIKHPIIVPIPLGEKRRKERGYNQAEEIAKRGAFRVAQDAAGSIDLLHTYIILDDVLTTGATLQAAIDAIQKAGAKHIIPLALAH